MFHMVHMSKTCRNIRKADFSFVVVNLFLHIIKVALGKLYSLKQKSQNGID